MRNRGRTKILFQKPIEGDDGFGPNPSAGGWTEGINIGVMLRPIRGSESEENGFVGGRQTYEIEVRTSYVMSDPKIDVTWRATRVETGTVFNIVSISQSDDDYRFSKVTITSGEVA